MKAMFINAPGEVEIKDVAAPVRKEGEVLLKLLYGGICGSDLGLKKKKTFCCFFRYIILKIFCLCIKALEN